MTDQCMTNKTNSRKRGKIKKAVIILFWLGVWELAARVTDNPILLAGPLQTAGELCGLFGEAAFYKTIFMSLLRIGAGFGAGFLTAIFLAAAGSRFSVLEEWLAPFMGLLKAVPVASFVVLLLIWWGSSFLALAVSFLVVLPVVYISVLEGLKNLDRELAEMGRVFCLPSASRFFYLYRPGLRPYLQGSLKTALGLAWKAGVAAEVIGTPDFSVGGRLYLSKLYLDTAGVFAWTATVLLLSFLFERAVLRGAEKFFAWQPACGKPRPVLKKGIGQQRKAETGRGRLPEAEEGNGESRKAETGGGRLPEAEEGNGESRKAETGRGRLPEAEEGNGESRKAESDRGEQRGSGRILLENVWKSFGDRTVLAGVSQVYEPGRIYYLRSPSGSGKTTPLRLLAGLERPDRGRIQVEGNCSMVFQEDRLCREYSAVKNVELVTGDATSARRALELLLEPGTTEQPCGELSGGMKRRVALVRAMEADSAVVLLDEPFAGMDDRTRARAEEYIRRRQGGRTLIIATHI